MATPLTQTQINQIAKSNQDYYASQGKASPAPAYVAPSGGGTAPSPGGGTDRVGGVSVNPNVPNADGTPYNAAKAAQAGVVPPVAPTMPGTPPVTPGAIPTTSGVTTPTSIVDTLKAAGQPSDFASRATMAGAQGIANYTGTADQNTELLKKYTQGLATAQATGKAPDNAGDAMATVKGSVPGNGYEGVATTDAYLQEEPIFAKIMDSFAEMMSPPKQSESLVSQYQNLLKTSGVEQINTELLNARKVIDGTEQDIRLETEKANGFASNSQIMALAVARNKSLMANYNSLLDTKNSLMDQINTTIQLSQQDRQYASQKLEQQMNFGFKMMEYRDKFQNNAKENYNNIIKAVGYQGLLESTGGDSHYTDMIERSLGLSPGGLAQLATYKAPISEEDKLNLDIKRGQLDIQKSNLLTDKAQRANIYDQIQKRNAPTPTISPTIDAMDADKAQNQIKLVKSSLEKANSLAHASGRSGLRRTAESWLVGSTDYTNLEAETNTLRTNVLTLATDPAIKKFFGPQMSNADVQLMTSAGTTLNPELQSPTNMRTELTRLTDLIGRMEKSVQQGGSPVVHSDQIPTGYYQASDGLFYKK